MAESIVHLPNPVPTDLIGHRFGKLTVIEFAEFRKGRQYWKCRCECGKEVIRLKGNIQNGRRSLDRQSCGCGRLKHGKTGTPEYMARIAILERCTNPKCKAYKNYGARGIKVCDRWRESFEAFFADMGPRPSTKHSIDRIDNNGDYCPENCRWATKKEQNRNRRDNHLITFRDQTLCLTEWASKLGLHPSTLDHRLKVMDFEEAMTGVKPKCGVIGNLITFNGITLPCSEWAKRIGIYRKIIASRLRKGWSIEKALTTPVEPRKPRIKK